ncbi:MAG TPA: T9SS type A sorting domain-containing protein [bacterium]
MLHIWQYSNPPAYQLSGQVIYYQEHDNVAETVFNLKFDNITLIDTSDVTGLYRFDNITEKYCKLIPKKNGDQRDAIAGSDALMLLQHLEYQTELNDDQKIAADVTGDQTISASDAEAIINYLAFLNTQIGSTGQWKFDPDTTLFWLRSDTTINFHAFLLGDVNVSWDRSDIIAGDEVDTTATLLKIARKNASSTKQISIPVAIENLDMPFHTLVFSVKYNPDILKFISAKKMSLSEKFILAANGNERGKIHFAMVGIYEITQPGEVIELGFENINKNYRILSTDLEILHAWINDLKVTQLENGRIIFSKPRFVDFESNFQSIQNYPNPFNSTTTISINLPIETDLKIAIFNTMGQTVTVLFDDKLKAGFHEIKWNGENEKGEALPSGVYFYRIESSSLAREDGAANVVIKKMILLR